MRINEKSLAKFASSGAPADKEGFLLKKGELNKGYQKRWFILKGNLLFYYEKRQDKEPVGVIVLEGCTIELSEHIDGFAFQIVFPKSGCRTYHLAADSQEEMEAWMKVLACASYDYMKLMVSELHQQLEELKENAQQQLVENATRDSHMISRSYSSFETTGKKKQQTRFNPFNTDIISEHSETDESLRSNSGSLSSPGMHRRVDKTPKTFLQMHEEYGRQVKSIGEMWRESYSARPTSAYELRYSDEC